MLEGKNIVVYDLEIENVIDGKEVTWSTHDKMGLSVGCLYDYSDGDYKVYFRNDMKSLVDRLNNAELIVAFNQIGFDNKLLRALGGDLKPDVDLPNFDMLYESRKSVGWREGDRFPKGLRLDNHLEATFGADLMKTDDGANAPILWQKGEIAQVTTYCLADVRREKMLFEHIVDKGWAATKEHGKRFFTLAPIKDVVNQSVFPI